MNWEDWNHFALCAGQVLGKMKLSEIMMFFQNEFIFNSDDDVVAPRLTQHLHRTLLKPSNAQEVGIPLNNQIAGWRKRMESEALRPDSSGSTVFSLFPLSMYQYFRMWDDVPRYQIVIILSHSKSQDFTVGQFWMELMWPSSILRLYESKCPQKKLKRAQLASEILCLCFLWDFSFSYLKPHT